MTKPDITKTITVKFSEDDIADRFVERFGKKIRYFQGMEQGWLILENGRWKRDYKLKSPHLIRLFCREIAVNEVESLPYSALNLTSAITIKAVEMLVCNDPRICVSDVGARNLITHSSLSGSTDIQ